MHAYESTAPNSNEHPTPPHNHTTQPTDNLPTPELKEPTPNKPLHHPRNPASPNNSHEEPPPNTPQSETQTPLPTLEQRITAFLNITTPDTLIHITCNPSLLGICALGILVPLLTREMLRHEVAFQPLPAGTCLQLTTEAAACTVPEEEPPATTHCAPECPTARIRGCAALLACATARDCRDAAPAWAAATALAFLSLPATATASSETSSETPRVPCTACAQLSETIALRFRLHPGTLALRYASEPRLPLPFLGATSLFDSIKNALPLLFEWRMFNTRAPRNAAQRVARPELFDRCDWKIGERLARAGVPNAAAAGRLALMPRAMQKTVENAFGMAETFVLHSGHDLQLPAVEHAFVLLALLARGDASEAFLALSTRRLMDAGSGWEAYARLVGVFRALLAGVRRAGEALVFRAVERLPVGAEEGCWVLWRLCVAYARGRGAEGAVVLQVDEGTRVLCYTESPGEAWAEGENAGVSHRFLVVSVPGEHPRALRRAIAACQAHSRGGVAAVRRPRRAGRPRRAEKAQRTGAEKENEEARVAAGSLDGAAETLAGVSALNNLKSNLEGSEAAEEEKKREGEAKNTPVEVLSDGCATADAVFKEKEEF